jgi:hypothetical protein
MCEITTATWPRPSRRRQRVARRPIDALESLERNVADRRLRLVASFGHERLVEPVERLEPGVEIGGRRLQDHAEAEATDPHLGALEAKSRGSRTA